jgi:DNA-directed RNA polymerase subunit RPC12/RpoP
MILASAGGGILVTIAVFGFAALWIAVKAQGYKSSRCRHCGHDNGISGASAPICSECGRNKTIIKPRRARKR